MSYDLAIYRYGALAQLRDHQNLKRPADFEDLEDCFKAQRSRIEETPEYKAAKKLIVDEAKVVDGQARFTEATFGTAEREAQESVITMPPLLDVPEAEALEESSHLVGLLPSERLAIRIGKIDWRVRVRASVTACALEVQGGLPKLWWTFEGVPNDPDPDKRPTEQDAAALFGFVNKLEQRTTKLLSDAYFSALQEVTSAKETVHDLGKERLRIRFVDNNDSQFTALIHAMRYRGLDPAAIERATAPGLVAAKHGMRDFAKLVKDSVAKDEIIDPKTATLEREIDLAGVDAVLARKECKSTISIVGLAQRPTARTSYDHLRSVRDQVITDNKEENLRAFSAARRLTGQLVAVEALRLELKHRVHLAAARPAERIPA